MSDIYFEDDRDLEVTISGKDIDGNTIVTKGKGKGYVVDEADRGGAEYAHLFMPSSFRIEDGNIRRKDFTVTARDWGGLGGGGEAAGGGASGDWSSSTSSYSSCDSSSSYSSCDSSSSDFGSCGGD